MDRRTFVRNSLAATAGAAMTFGFEEQNLLAHAAENDKKEPPKPAEPAAFPCGKIGDLEISRIICGGNLISGHAHSRDLMYVSKLLMHYFTDEKVMETLALAEKSGVNTAILRYDERTVRLINKYWREYNGSLQWIAQLKPQENDLAADARKAVDMGAVGLYVQGETSDRWVRTGRADLLGKALDALRRTGVIVGLGAHAIQVLHACEKDKVVPDFFMKTFNSKSYWSAGPKDRNDSVWEETPEETAAFMKTSNVPWIAFKVLGAGAIPPEEGFKYAFEHGADFLCVGMFDFQVEEDVRIARQLLAGDLKRERAWKA